MSRQHSSAERSLAVLGWTIVAGVLFWAGALVYGIATHNGALVVAMAAVPAGLVVSAMIARYLRVNR